MLLGKCPRCRVGDMFDPPRLRFFSGQHMHSSCPVCGIEFEVEPGFFWGAMYFSYALNVAESVALAVAVYISSMFTGFGSPWLYVGVIIPGIFLFMNLNFRYGRLLLIYLFGEIDYDDSYSTYSNPSKVT